MALRIEPNGIMRMHSENQSINSDDKTGKAAAIADTLNTPRYLLENFFGNPQALHSEHLPSGGMVCVIEPTGKYSEKSFLVIAAGPDTFKHQPIATEQIYQYPADVQQAYWRNILRVMQTLQQDADDQSIVVATENCIYERTNQDKRTSRSVAPPHAQVSVVNPSHIEPNGVHELDHLHNEQRALRFAKNQETLPTTVQEVLQRNVGNKTAARNLPEALRTEFSRRIGKNVQITTQEHAPYGYSFVVAQSLDVETVTEMLAAHHAAYTEISRAWFSSLRSKHQEKLIPQPSYRLYLTVEEGQLIATISPEFLSHAGVMEAAGVFLQRKQEIQPRISEAEKVAIRQTVIQALTGNP